MNETTTHKDQVAWDVLTTAFDYGYTEEWFEVLDHERNDHDSTIRWAKVRLSEGYGDEDPASPLQASAEWFLDARTVRRGFKRYTAWVRENDPAHRSYLGEQWAVAHDPEGSGWDELDAIGADAVLQFACFGEVVFG